MFDPKVTEVIARDDASAFLRGIENTISKMLPEQIEAVYLYSFQRNAIVVSFDGDWKPFFGYTRGYNYPDDRTYLVGGGPFLALVRSRFKHLPHDISGGRVFLGSSYAYRAPLDMDKEVEVFLRYIWLGNSLNLVEDALKVLWQALY